jgi:AraC-like DNA-binding protein/mannose-6-phosphate isomerase-like protein (cupin superfamily)
MAGPPRLFIRTLSTFAPDDTLSELLRSLRVQSTLFCLAEVGAPWGFAVPQRRVASFHLVLEGEAWLTRDGDKPLRLGRGDVAIVPRGDPHELRDAPGSPVSRIEDEQESGSSWEVHFGGDGVRAELMCGGFALDHVHPLVAALPPVVHVGAVDGRPPEWLAATLALLRGELPACPPGSEAVVTKITDVFLAHAIRAFVVEHDAGALAALADPPVSAAVRLIHERPEHPWSVEELARRVALSRSALAARFREIVGEPPMRYVARCRLTRAAELLRETDAPIGAVARACGYGSAVSLSKAFTRWFGVAPGGYRRVAAARGRAARNAASD